MGIVLALDYGEQRIGVAVTDAEQRTALARGIVASQPEARAVEQLREIVMAESVERIVVGLPLTLEGTEGPQAKRTRAFGVSLEGVTNIPVDYVDERFTTRQAQTSAAVTGTSTDAEAARLILQSWLDRKIQSRTNHVAAS